MKYITLPVVALCLSTSLHSVHAATERDLDSHEHGGATLNIAVDGQQLIIEFESPWVNLVGFEHKPSTDEQSAAVANATQQLEKADGLFVFAGAECVLAESHVESSMAEDTEHDEKQEGEEHEGGEHEEGESHSAVVASYVFDCADMGKLDTLNVELFDVWSGIDDIDVQLVGPAGQSAVELMPGRTTLEAGSVL